MLFGKTQMEVVMQEYFLKNLSELAQKRAVLMREEAQLWDILARDLTREARRREEQDSSRPPVRTSAPALPPKPDVPSERKILVGIAEAARMMGLGRSSLYNEIGAGRLTVKKAGNRTLIAVADIEAWCDNLPEGVR